MEAVPKVNIDGLYLEDMLMDDAISGIVPFYEEIEPQPPADPDEEGDAEGQPEEEAEPEITGYIVGVPVMPGLFMPRFDIPAWEAYQDDLQAAESDYRQAYDEWQVQPEDERAEPPTYVAPEMPTLWIEGLTPEEIDELTRPQPQEPNEVDRLGSEIVARELEAMELRQQNEAQGAQIVGLELRLLSLENS
ncbi:hypothetical protein ABER23_25390 [Paenibacillus lautus]|uniref:hypothetical protein n=1 Tax=Paenibacillus lautus TaxID=1401 RepID=UPI003D28094A